MNCTKELGGLKLTKAEQRKEMIHNFLYASLGMLLFGIGLNVFVTPLNFLSGGAVGIAQLFRDFLFGLGLSDPGFDLVGVFYLLLNVPLLYLGYTALGKNFTIRTCIMIVIFSLTLTFVPVPAQPLLHDPLTASIVGGVLAGIGSGFTLTAGYAAGGMDILGLYLAKKVPGFSVGRLGLIVNAIVFSTMFLTKSFEVVVYSFLFTAAISVATDRFHSQNINVWLIIFTKKEGVDKLILNKLSRGVTSWDGAGAYTGDHTYIHATMINKFEMVRAKQLVLQEDPKAFMILNEGASVAGNFLKKL